MEVEKEEEPIGLSGSLESDAKHPFFDHTHPSTSLLSFPLSLLMSYIGWSKKQDELLFSKEGVESMAAVAAGALALSVAGMYHTDHHHHKAQKSTPHTAKSHSVHATHALPSMCDGLRIASIEPQEHVIHGASVASCSHAIQYEETYRKNESEMEQEMERLRNQVHSLLERERTLELQMFEYYEQEVAVEELESRVREASTQANSLATVVDSLQEQNQRLRQQVSDLENMKGKSDGTKAKIKLLKTQVRLDRENSREVIDSLRERIAVLEKDDDGDASSDAHVSVDVEIESHFRRVREMEEEMAELRRKNLELAQRLENAHASSIHKVRDDILEEASSLKETNDKLSRELEDLRNSHFSHVEELVYLRWINACLRYELRNFHPEQGRIAAKDLNKSLSYRSRENAKQLLQEYSNLGIDLPENLLATVALETHTTPQPSGLTEKGGMKARKFLNNLKNLVTGGGNSNQKNKKKLAADKSLSLPRPKSSAGMPCSAPQHDVLERTSFEKASSCPSAEQTPTSQVTMVQSQTRLHKLNASISVLGSAKLDKEGGGRSKSDLGATLGR